VSYNTLYDVCLSVCACVRACHHRHHHHSSSVISMMFVVPHISARGLGGVASSSSMVSPLTLL